MTQNNLPLWPLKSDDPAIAEYESILPQLQQFRKARPEFLKGSTLLGYGENNKTSVPTICLLAHAGSLRELDKEELEELGRMTTLPVEVFESRTRRCVNVSPTAKDQLDIVGVGINTSSNRSGSGTCGGFLKDTKSGKLYGLTNHHVVTDATGPITEDSKRPQEPQPIYAFSPSDRSLRMELGTITRDIEHTIVSLKSHRTIATTEDDFELIATLKENLVKLGARKQETEGELERENERMFGKVVASSGVRYETYVKEDGKTYVRTRDWALIEIDVTKEMEEKHNPNLSNDWTWSENGQNKTLRLLPKGYRAFTPKDIRVLKRGARTGVTSGRIHATYIELRIEGNSVDTTEEAICPENQGDFWFSDGGDSGALVVDRCGIVIGQIFGGELITRGGRNYVMSYYQPIKSILDDIREATGMDSLVFV